ncbi:MAG: hypothetical protein IPN38_02390 [Flavobacteriales bacterium]|nr:hypothetical protein [Flavobacteriales bacterium]
MRTLLGLLAFLLATVQGHATNLLDQLRAFNPYWADHAEHLTGKPARPISNDVDYVQAHLAEVLGVLSQAPTSQLSADQLRSRKELIAVLADYSRQGRFPINYYRQERIPVFIDEHDTYCAVGYLMRHTGHEAMARRIAAANNYAWVREIEEPGLTAWQRASGFSLEELKLIQGAYDYYLPDAFLLPNKYEVPQKPERVVRYFEGADKDKVWCSGEGTLNELHGQWIQNYSSKLPWIVGYFEHGKRSGHWKEFYKGTDKLCRTEHWRDDKLNGIRTRYDREGRVIETILFKNGQAVTKTNIDHDKALRHVRTPLDSATVYTEVFTEEGSLIAAGKERIHNPEGLQWFQNIELTALNTFAITARDGAPRPEEGVFVRQSRFFPFEQSMQQIPGSHPLVQYRKEGAWIYYKDYLSTLWPDGTAASAEQRFSNGYKHFGPELHARIARYDHLEIRASYDSMRVVYTDDRLVDFFGYRAEEQDHLEFTYHPSFQRLVMPDSGRRWNNMEPTPAISQVARLDREGRLIGVRVDYDAEGTATREERFLVPYKREAELLGVR